MFVAATLQQGVDEEEDPKLFSTSKINELFQRLRRLFLHGVLQDIHEVSLL